MLTEEQVCERVAKLVLKDGVRGFAEANGLSPAYVSRVARGEMKPGKKILDVLGLVKVVAYKEKR